MRDLQFRSCARQGSTCKFQGGARGSVLCMQLGIQSDHLRERRHNVKNSVANGVELARCAVCGDESHLEEKRGSHRSHHDGPRGGEDVLAICAPCTTTEQNRMIPDFLNLHGASTCQLHSQHSQLSLWKRCARSYDGARCCVQGCAARVDHAKRKGERGARGFHILPKVAMQGGL